MRLSLFTFLVFVGILGAAQSVREWKKFENGKVESHKKAYRTSKNHTTDSDGKVQRILHSHHGNRHEGKNIEKQEPVEVTKEQTKWDGYRKNKERHHKTEKKRAHNLSENHHKAEKEEQAKGLVNVADDVTSVKEKKKHSKKLDGMKSLKWKRSQRQAEKKKTEKVKTANAKKQLPQKKMVISKMDGNHKAKQMWKDAFRGENRITNAKK